jgi:hypothetical protein
MTGKALQWTGLGSEQQFALRRGRFYNQVPLFDGSPSLITNRRYFLGE